MNLKIIFSILVISIIILSPSKNSFASDIEPIRITISQGMEEIIFDGKWTNFGEWKPSSHNMFAFDDGMTIHLRTAHYGNFIYVFVDPIDDQTIDNKIDKATVCFDGKNNKNMIYDKDDYCFSVSLDQKQGIIQQGLEDGNFNIINAEEFIAISSVSDENDRYTKTPHPSYEFKIPIELLERSDNYGFYLSVYDASADKNYSWPENATRENSIDIPSPSKWGDIVSPDKSMPELNLPSIVLMISIFAIIVIQFRMPALIKRF
jgi:hypothetical protein